MSLFYHYLPCNQRHVHGLPSTTVWREGERINVFSVDHIYESKSAKILNNLSKFNDN